MIALLALALADTPAAEPAQSPARSTVATVRQATLNGRPTVLLVLRGDIERMDVRREGSDLVARLPGVEPTLQLPPAQPPVAGFRLEAGPPALLRISLTEGVAHEVVQEGPLVRIILGGTGAAAASDRPPVTDLYPLLLPPAADEAGGQVIGQAEGETPKEDEGGLGVRIKPGVTGSLVHSRAAITDSPDPVETTYYEVQPDVRLIASPFNTTLRLTYQPRFRFFTNYAEIREPSHLVEGALSVPLSPMLTLRASDRWARGYLETREVDPGSEYFFDLTRFTRNAWEVGARLEMPSGLGADVALGRNEVSFDENGAFFDYVADSAAAMVSYELSPSYQGRLRYTYSHIPTPDERPVAEQTTHAIEAGVQGELMLYLKGGAWVGWEHLEAPKAPDGGNAKDTLTIGANLVREFTRGSKLSIDASRSTLPSAFELNAFYRSAYVGSDLAMTGPFETTVHGGLWYRWNDYFTDAVGAGEPRADRILGLSVGAGRSILKWFYVRVDYVRERRTSNLAFANNTTTNFLFQLGFATGSES